MGTLSLEPLKKKQKRYSVSFSDFGKVDDGVTSNRLLAQTMINCDCQSGVLSTGLGVEGYYRQGKAVPSKEKASRFFVVDSSPTLDSSPETALLCLTESGDLYRFNEKTQAYVYQLAASPYSQLAYVVDENGQKSLFVSSDEEYFVYTNGEWSSFDFVAAIPAMCVCKDRVFLALRKATIAYSDPSYPYHFTELAGGGKFRLAYDFGEIVAMVCLDDDVYVFHQYGVARMSVGGEVDSFAVQPMDYCGGEIYGASVGVCGNGIFFLAVDGVYRFDGTKFHHVEGAGRIVPKTDEKLCHFAVYGNRYILQYVDIDGQTQTVVVAGDGKSGYSMGEKKALSYSGGAALCQSGNYVVRLRENAGLPSTEQAVFTTQKTDFGVAGRKTLQKICVRGRGSVAMLVVAKGFQREYNLVFDGGVAWVDLAVLGEEFYFSFTLGQNACVQEVSVDFSVVKGG